MEAWSRAAWLGVALGCFAETAAGQALGVRGGVSPIQENGRFSIIAENDLFSFGVGTPTDRFYSNGIYLHSDWTSPLLDSATKWLAVGPFVPASHRSYVGLGLSHELHTPATINACASRYGDPLATPEAPGRVDPALCADAERDWAQNYADQDFPFSAVWSVFATAQRYFHRNATKGAFTQFRVWGRTDLGGYGRGAGLGYAVQKNWHGFFNDAFVKKGDTLATTPSGWLAQGDDAPEHLLVQVSAGADMSLLRWANGVISDHAFPGVELDGRVHARAITPRNQLGAGVTLRGGLLPEHASAPTRPPGVAQAWNLYLEASADATAVITDYTYGAIDEYRHFLDEYSLGAHLKIMGVGLGASLNFQRQLFIDPLEKYPSRERVTEPFHRYGRVAVEFTY